MIRISGKGINVGEALRTRVSDRIAEAMAKYFDGSYSGHATIGKDGSGFNTECALHLDSGMTLEASSASADAYASADQAVALIEKRLRRYKNRIKDRHARKVGAQVEPLSALSAASYIIETPRQEDEIAEEFSPVIIAETTTSLKQLSVSEAVQELDLTGAPVIVFQHGTSGSVNIVYRRNDGNIGWIEPPAAQKI